MARIMGSQVRGAEGDRNQEAKSVYRGEIKKMTGTWLGGDEIGDEGRCRSSGFDR